MKDIDNSEHQCQIENDGSMNIGMCRNLEVNIGGSTRVSSIGMLEVI